MGCIFSRCFSSKVSPSLSEPKYKTRSDQSSTVSEETYDDYYLEPEPLAPRPSSSPSAASSTESKLFTSNLRQHVQSRVELHIPIYIARKTYEKTDDIHLSIEEGDELELINEINSSEICVNHLRSGLSGRIPKSYVELDENTPLRLAVNDRGIIQQCLMQFNKPGGYLIRRSGASPNNYVLSILQYNEQHNTFDWQYLICINPVNHCFYFSQEDSLKDLYFKSFQQLIHDTDVQNLIPLTDILPYTIEFEEDIWKIQFESLVIKNQIGEGQFGEVSLADWRKGQTTIAVAVKRLHIKSVTSTVEREIDAMKRLRNIYIVTLYGISQNPTTDEILIVTEFMEKGDLKSWLKRCTQLPDYSILLRLAKDISSGMTYLEYKNYVHRDLACRNILLGPNDSVKIADFGLSTIVKTDDNDNEQRQFAQSEKLPVRWLAPELLDNQAEYSIKSDVWSFGILLIEIWLKGGDPYNGEHLLWIQSAVQTGYVHKKPDECPDDFYECVICQCLKFNPNDRLSFSALRQLFEKWIRDIVVC